jgi:hypothetical protein
VLAGDNRAAGVPPAAATSTEKHPAAIRAATAATATHITQARYARLRVR